MKDRDCTTFLQWCLPRLGMRWSGFRKVRRQVCKRIKRHLRELDLADVGAYRHHLEEHPAEWQVLDRLCQITISCFYRDKAVFFDLGEKVLPTLAAEAWKRGDTELRCWSIGCASGEEPYTLNILWRLGLGRKLPGRSLSIVATDLDATLLQRAREARYHAGSLRRMPEGWRERAFERAGEAYRIKPFYRRGIKFRLEDVRTHQPDGPFDLILCRNLVFTYFDLSVQQEVLSRLMARLSPGGFLVIGAHENLPAGAEKNFDSAGRCTYRKPEKPPAVAQRAYEPVSTASPIPCRPPGCRTPPGDAKGQGALASRRAIPFQRRRNIGAVAGEPLANGLTIGERGTEQSEGHDIAPTRT